MADGHLEFEFEVGETGRHKAFRFDQLLGPLPISVDGEPVIRKFETFSLRRTGHDDFSVGSDEPQECVTYVDGQEIGRYSNTS